MLFYRMWATPARNGYCHWLGPVCWTATNQRTASSLLSRAPNRISSVNWMDWCWQVPVSPQSPEPVQIWSHFHLCVLPPPSLSLSLSSIFFSGLGSSFLLDVIFSYRYFIEDERTPCSQGLVPLAGPHMSVCDQSANRLTYWPVNPSAALPPPPPFNLPPLPHPRATRRPAAIHVSCFLVSFWFFFAVLNVDLLLSTYGEKK